MPTLQAPGVITPGELGPMIVVDRPARYRFVRTMSCTGTPSAMITAIWIPASTASSKESVAIAGGTKMPLTVAPVSSTASTTELKTGRPRCVVPPLPGVTPPTTLVPNDIDSSAWKVACCPVKPWMMTRDSLST
jgi:hypothetical protein